MWKGTSLELIATFAQPEIINRIHIELDDYQGLEIVSFTTSPDGTLTEDVLVDLDLTTIHLNGIVDKYSGDFILDFSPRHAKQVRLVIED